jgi:hypothetical protein
VHFFRSLFFFFFFFSLSLVRCFLFLLFLIGAPLLSRSFLSSLLALNEAMPRNTPCCLRCPWLPCASVQVDSQLGGLALRERRRQPFDGGTRFQPLDLKGPAATPPNAAHVGAGTDSTAAAGESTAPAK